MWDLSTRRRGNAAAEILAAAWRPGVVLVASSDFTHYGQEFGFEPFPNDAAIEHNLHELDFACIDAASSLHADLFLKVLDHNGATVCGRAPVALLLESLRRTGRSIYQSTLDYQTSGEINGDFGHSVSYAALGYYDRACFNLDPDDSQTLHHVAEGWHWRDCADREARDGESAERAGCVDGAPRSVREPAPRRSRPTRLRGQSGRQELSSRGRGGSS